MVKNLQQDAQKLVEREKAPNGRQGVILAKENALGAEKARLVAVAKDSVYYEQEASSLLVENEKLQNKLAEKDQTIGELKERLAEYEPRRGMRPSGGYEPD